MKMGKIHQKFGRFWKENENQCFSSKKKRKQEMG
jgi:hypothetical protein